MLNLLYSHYSPDTIMRSILRVSEASQQVNPLCLEEGIQQGRWHLDQAGRFVLSLPSAMTVAFARRDYLLNRAFIYDESLQAVETDEFPLKVVQLETECTFRHLIDSTGQRSARTGLYGLCGDYLPLYLQWQSVQALGLALETPRYDYAFGNLKPAIDDFANTIYTSPFDLRTWQPNSPPERDWHTFVLERPAGVPVIATVINQSVVLSERLTQATEQRLQDASQAISRLFGSIFGELLFFVDDDAITFAAFSHSTSNAVDDSVMDVAMEKELHALEAL